VKFCSENKNLQPKQSSSFNIRGIPVTLTAKTLASGNSPATAIGQIKSVEILVDTASIEAFVNHGEISSTCFVLPHENGLSVKAEDGPVTIKSLIIYPLKSAWPANMSR